MKKLLLLVGLVVLYSFSSLGDITDDKLKNEYNKLIDKYPSGYQIWCREQKTTAGNVKWDLHKVYYIVEKSKKVFFVWSSDEEGVLMKNYPALLINQSKPDPIVYSSNKIVVWHFEGSSEVFFSYHKKAKELIIDLDDDKIINQIKLVRILKHRMRIMPDNGSLMNCTISGQ